jgi:hypothetical protein
VAKRVEVVASSREASELLGLLAEGQAPFEGERDERPGVLAAAISGGSALTAKRRSAASSSQPC